MAEPSLRLADKPRVFLEGWSIDLIINIEPEISEGYCHYIVNINCVAVKDSPCMTFLSGLKYSQSKKSYQPWLQTGLITS